MATKKLSLALLALTTPEFGFSVKMPTITIGATVVTASGAEMNYLIGVTSNIQTQLDAKLASVLYTAADVFAKVLTLDGHGSGLDADKLDNQHGSYYAPTASPTFTGAVTMPGTGTWTAVGRVGIGTVAPAYKCDIVGDANVTGMYRVNGIAGLDYLGLDVVVGSASAGANSLRFNAGAADRMFIDKTTGYVGVNKIAPVKMLDVVGDIQATGDVIAYA